MRRAINVVPQRVKKVSASWKKGRAGVVGVLSLPLFLPPSTFYLFGVNSHAAGLAVASLSLIVVAYLSIRLKVRVLPATVIMCFIAGHLLVAASFQPLQIGRALASLSLLALMGAAAAYLSSWLIVTPGPVITRTTSALRTAMVLIAVMSLLGLQPPSPLPTKPIFPFTEPSHYALIFTPLLIDGCVRNKAWKRYFLLCVGFALGYLLQSLSLIVGTILAALVCLSTLRLILLGAAGAVLIGYLDIAYFLDRLDFSSTATNRSTLTYIQGWELAFDSLVTTNGWGLGFQQLGYGTVRGAAADALYRMMGSEANVQDGGFVVSKLVSEFGVAGILATALFLFLAGRLAIRLRTAAAGNGFLSSIDIYMFSIFVGYTVDMLVRGIGYFTGSTLLFITSILFIFAVRRNRTRSFPAVSQPPRNLRVSRRSFST